jgi:hypothetical protein
MTTQKIRVSVWLIFLFSCAAQLASVADAGPRTDLLPQVEITVTHTDKTKYGYLLTVEITNNSARTLYFPTISYLSSDNLAPPQINSLAVEQWSDGKSNILPGGRTLDSAGPLKPGFFSVGPCHDDPWDGKWIVLQPGKSFQDQITAFEPPTGYITVMCRWRSAHLGGDARISLGGYLSRRARKWIDFYSSTFQLPPFK